MGQNVPRSFGSSDLPPIPEGLNQKQLDIYKQMHEMDRIDHVKAIHWEASPDGKQKN